MPNGWTWGRLKGRRHPRRLIYLNLTLRIIEEITNESALSHAAKSVYLKAMLKQPQTLRALGLETQLNPRTVARHCRELSRLGWMRLLEGEGRQLPSAVIPRPVEAILAIEAAKQVEMAHYKGEETTKIFLDWITAASVNFRYDCRPKFLVNPETDQNLEYDMYSEEHKWATEFHGDQHFGLTRLYPNKEDLRDRQKRDLMKVGLSQNNGIRLSIVTKHDLSLKKLLPMIPKDVPKRDFDPAGPLVQMLERIGKECAGRQDWDRG